MPFFWTKKHLDLFSRRLVHPYVSTYSHYSHSKLHKLQTSCSPFLARLANLNYLADDPSDFN